MTTRNPLSNLEEDPAATIGEDSDDEKNAALGDTTVENQGCLSSTKAQLVPAVPLLAVVCIAGVLGLIAVLLVAGSSGESGSDLTIGFGSCTSYDLRDEPIWAEGVIPSAIDAWIWVGDMVYLDDPSVNCELVPTSQQCNCDDDWLRTSTHGCMAGDPEHAQERWQAALSSPGYRSFLEYMCPGNAKLGVFPPPGTDPEVCPRPILGTWDDHDYGWNNGDRREPDKQRFKTMYLDAVGEAQNSPRRSSVRGMWGSHVLQATGGGPEVEVFLLDERYDRSPLPCWTRRAYCESVLASPASEPKHAWCVDFLRDGHEFGIDGVEGCCDKDERLFLGWCNQEGAADHPLYKEACEVQNEAFGSRMLWLTDDGSGPSAIPPDASERPIDDEEGSPICEVLGRPQRQWLKAALAASDAPVKLLVSGSVVLGNPTWRDARGHAENLNTSSSSSSTSAQQVDTFCSGDDLDCFAPAQRELLYLAASTSGCTIILTGDYHWTDIKVLKAGEPADGYYGVANALYNSPGGAREFPASGVVQVMSSGLTESTSPNETCAAWLARGYTEDVVGLRQRWTDDDDDDSNDGDESSTTISSSSSSNGCDRLVGGSFATIKVSSAHDGKLSRVTAQLRDKHGKIHYERAIAASECRGLQ